MSFVEVKNITKNYGRVNALNNVSVLFEENKICGLLGRNGAGKTTLLNLITGKIFPDSGQVFIDNENVKENDAALSKVYCMSEQTLYPEGMSVKNALGWTKEFYPDMDCKYAEELAAKFSLNTKKKIKTLSTGYDSVFKIIAALSCNAPVLLLDEPVLGLDANFRDLFYRELLACYSRQPRTIVISTHLIEEAADVIEKVVIIKNGEIIINDMTQNVLTKGYTVTGPAQTVDSFIARRNVLGTDILGGIKSAYILESIRPDNVPDGIEVSRMRLQNLFIHLTNNGGIR